mmetsp:Transcript_36187/g.84611  ORF Transcript_36187/g.84611 Transcript_36187/m.84611 type:complete len:248 (+) Transcript_36187:1138-1881(+)
MSHELIFLAGLHDDRNSSDQVRRLHAYGGGLVVEAPLDGSGNLFEIGFATQSQGIDDGAEAVQHDHSVLARPVGRLFLKGVEDTVDESFLETSIDISGAEIFEDALYGLHDHATIGFGVVLEVVDDAGDDVGASDLIGELFRGLDDLSAVAAVEGHASYPEMSEEVRQDFFADVSGLDSRRGYTLFDDLEHNFLHFFVRALKFPYQHRHDHPGVVAGVSFFHERNDVSDGFEKCRQSLATMLFDTPP